MSYGDLDFDFSDKIVDLKRQLTDRKNEETTLLNGLESLVEEHVEVPRQLSRALQRMNTRLTLVESDVSQLCTSLKHTSVIAENISSKVNILINGLGLLLNGVRDLDTAKSRVVDCLQRVEDLLDLDLCTEGVQVALSQEDYEQAATHIHRFLSLDADIFQLGAQWETDKSVSSATGSVGHSVEVLKQAQQTLTDITTQRMQEAVADDDAASIERFFKLFPLINQHDTGIRLFAEYLKRKITNTATKNYEVMKAGGQDPQRANVLFADTLTLLFEGIARVIEIHQPLIDKHYGHDRLANFIQHLQVVCDEQTNLIVDEFVKVRQYDRKCRLIQASIERDDDKQQQQMASVSKLDTPDPLELDVLLSEVTLMQTRAEMYQRFLRRRILGASPESVVPADKKASILHMIAQSGTAQRMQELIGAYIAMEQFYMDRSMKRSIANDDMDTGDQLHSSMVDDVLFLTRKCVRRALSSGNVDCVCAVINNAAIQLDTNYARALSIAINNGYPSVGSFAEAYTTAAAAYSSFQQGKMPVSAGDGAERQRQQFVVTLNNVQTSEQYLVTLRDTINADIEHYFPAQHMRTPSDREKLKASVSQLDDFATTMAQIRRAGVNQLVVGAVKPRIKAAVAGYLDYSHVPDEHMFADFEVNDPFIEGFVTVVDQILISFKSAVTEVCYQDFAVELSSEVARQLEKVIMQCTFNRLGALQLDKEIRELNTYLTGVVGWTVRERISRVNMICSLLNVDSTSEALDIWQHQQDSVEHAFRLSQSEYRKIMALRVDLAAVK